MPQVNSLYRKLIEAINRNGEKYTDEQMQEVFKLQKSKLDEFHTLIALLFLKYATDGLLKVTPGQKNSLMSQVNDKLKEMGKSLGEKEVETLSNTLSQVYKDTYYQNAYVISEGLKTKPKFNIINQKKVDAAVNIELDGQMFSDRIWTNKADMIDKLQKGIVEAMQGNTTVDKIGRDIQETFNINAYESQRLAVTELTRVQAQGQTDIAKDIGIEKQMWSATLDTKVCDECAALDGKVFAINDESRPEMPLHPNDRCCWINVVDGWQPSQRWDNENKEFIDYQQYNNWLQNNVSNGENSGIINSEEKARKNILEQQNLSIDMGQQNKHIPGTNQYKQYVQKYNKKGQYGPSIIELSEEQIKELIDKYHGTGIIKMNKKGKWDNKEIILDNDTVVGKAVNNISGIKVDTTVFKIHYSKDGAHIVPDYPSKKRRRAHNG